MSVSNRPLVRQPLDKVAARIAVPSAGGGQGRPAPRLMDAAHWAGRGGARGGWADPVLACAGLSC